MPSPEAVFLDSFQPQFYHDVDQLAQEMEPQIVQELASDGITPFDGEPYKTALAIIKEDLEKYQQDLIREEVA